MNPNLEHAKTAVDLAISVVTIGTLVGYLPAIAALLSIIWSMIRLYDRFKGRRDDS